MKPNTTSTHERPLKGSITSAETIPPRRPDLPRIRAYYNQTQLDYRVVWLNRENRAMHFGYWDASTRGHGDSLLNMNRQMAKRMGIKAGDRVLDAGCGVGGSAIWLVKNYDVSVVGITPVAGQVKRAYKYARQHGVADRLTFQQQDYTATPFADASFDAVWAMESVCHAPDKTLFLAEARRLLRPGGRLGIAEYMRTGRHNRVDDEKLLRRWLDGWCMPDLGTGEEFRRWAGVAGFSNIELRDISPNVRPSLKRMYRITVRLLPLAIVLHALRLRTSLQRGNYDGTRAQYPALERGLWFYGILTATAAG